MIRFWWLGAALLATGCTSMSSLQTARVMPEGKSRFFLGGGVLSSEALSATDSTGEASGLFFLEAGARFGFIEKWDAGVKYTLPGMLSGDVKLNLYEDDEWAAAMGFGVGYMAIENGSTDPESDGFREEVLDLIVPLYASYDLSPVLGFYLSPRYIHRETTSVTMHLIGAAGGVRIGNYGGGFLEVAAAADTQSDYSQVQFNVGIFLGNGPSVPTAAEAAPAK